MSTKRLKMKRKVVAKSQSSEASSEDVEGSSSSSSSSESTDSEEEVVVKMEKRRKRKHKHHVRSHSVEVDVERHHRRHRHRKKEMDDYGAEMRNDHEQRQRKFHRKRGMMLYGYSSDVVIKHEPMDVMDSLHRSHKRHKSPDGHAGHRHRGTDSDSRMERYRRQDQGDHRRLDYNDHRRTDQDEHLRLDRRKQPEEWSPHRSRHRELGAEEWSPHRPSRHRELGAEEWSPHRPSRHRELGAEEWSPHRSRHRELGAEEWSPHRPRHRESGQWEDDRAQRNGRPQRERRERTIKEEQAEGDYEWGKQAEKKDAAGKDPAAEKEKPNFGLSGKLAEDTNTVKGIVVKYSEPPEARKPKKRWRLYPFKGEKSLPTLYVHRQSAYLIGRDRKVADLPVDHPSCSKQHAVFQYRLLPYTREDGTTGRRIRPYIIDLESANGTFLNNTKIEPRKYVEVLERDVIKFGFSSREYVLLHEHSKDDFADDDVQEEQTAEQPPPP